MAESNSKLADALEKAMADTFAFYFMAHSCHWNVTGELFAALHTFFGDIYDDAHGAVDALAERIRTLDIPAPIDLAELLSLSKIGPAPKGDCQAMVKALVDANEQVIMGLGAAYHAANKESEVGLSNFLQDRIDTHAKWHWMLKASLEKEED